MAERRVNPEQVVEIRRRVQGAFGELRRMGFITKTNFSCCMTCAIAELGEIAEKRHRNKAVYWHRQDDEHFKKTGQLYIRFCYLPPPGIEGDTIPLETEIGEKVAAALRKQGLELDWSGNPNQTIRVMGVRNGAQAGKEAPNGPTTTV